MRPLGRWTSFWVPVAVLLQAAGCGDDEDGCPPLVVSAETGCNTSQDCVEAGFTTLQCVNQQCQLPCQSDRDCQLAASEACIAESGTPPRAVCINKLCRVRCTDSSCPEGQVCHAGDCVLGFEDFEARDGVPPSLERFGWNQVSGRELENPNIALVSEGLANCNLGDDDCAGVAASGSRFVVLGTQATSEKGTPTLEPTCRPCACCFECVVQPDAYAAGDADCPFLATIPAPLSCPGEVPAACTAICEACESCPSALPERTLGQNLLSCEETAAQRVCPSCPVCQGEACRTCREEQCAIPCENPDNPDCVVCEEANCPSCEDCRACDVCGEARSCEQVDPNAAECRLKRMSCDALGEDGCLPTPIGYPRSQLRPLEQALVSPEIDLSGGSRPIVLSFAYVPFGIGDFYFESRQGVPASQWERVPQELRIELCAEDCGDDLAWQSAEFLRGGGASVPPEGRRDNGLSVGRQSAVDWRSGRVEVRVPAELRTATFRFRFLPRLSSEARIGIDDVRWREER